MTPRAVSIEDLLITGRPAVLRGIPAEFLLHVTRLELDVVALAHRDPNILSFGRATVVARSTARAVQDGLAKVSGGDVPLGLVSGELAKFDPLLDLTRWPLNLRVERLVLHNDALELLLVGQGG